MVNDSKKNLNFIVTELIDSYFCLYIRLEEFDLLESSHKENLTKT